MNSEEHELCLSPVTKDLLQVPGQNGSRHKQNGTNHNGAPKTGLPEGGSPSQPSSPAEREYPEGGWGWVVCLASFTTNGVVFGIINTYGFLYKTMLETYGDNDPTIGFKASLVGSLCTGMTFFTSPIASILTDKWGIQKTSMIGVILSLIGIVSSSFVNQLEVLYLTYGVILGVGLSLTYNPSLVILGHYFKKKIGMVNGVVTLGSSIFTVIVSFLMPYLLKKIGLFWTMRVMAGFVACLLACPFIWRPLISNQRKVKCETGNAIDFLSVESIYEHVSGSCHDCCVFIRRFVNVRIWKKKSYVIWAIAVPIAFFGYFIPFVHLVKYVEITFTAEGGLNNRDSILIMTIVSTSGISRLVFGKVSDFPMVNRVRVQQASFVILGITAICIPFAKEFWALVLICAIMGLCDGCFVCLLGPIAFDIVGHRGAPQALGFVLGLASIPMMAGPAIAGIIYDTAGSYDIAFYYAGCPPIIGACIMFFIPTMLQHFPHVTEVEVIGIEIDLCEDDEDDYHKNYQDPEGIWHLAGSRYIGLDQPPPKPKSKTINVYQPVMTRCDTEDDKVEVVEVRESVM